MSYEWFNPEKSYGNEIECEAPTLDNYHILRENMVNTIPFEYRNQVKFIFSEISDLPNLFAWKYTPRAGVYRQYDHVRLNQYDELFRTANRISAEKDEPEGSRYIQISETLVNKLLGEQ